MIRQGSVRSRTPLGPGRRARAAAGLLALAATLACSGDATAPRQEPPPTTPPDTIRITVGGVIGRQVFPVGNSASGGQGQPVGGVRCIDGMIASHTHSHVSLFVNGEQLAIPPAIGVTAPQMVDGFVFDGDCFYWLHTHDATGMIHVEPPTVQQLTLGQLFDVWGRTLSRTEVAGYTGTVTVHVDGVLYTGDPRAIVLAPHREVTLQVGSPVVTPPVYIFPAGH